MSSFGGTTIYIAGWGQAANSLENAAAKLNFAGKSIFHSVCEWMPSGSRSYCDHLLDTIASISGEVILVGWSMGGMVALEACARVPQRIRNLVLLSSAPRFLYSADFPTGCPESILSIMRQGMDLNATETLAEFFKAVHAPQRIERSMLEQKVEVALEFGTPSLVAGLDYLATFDITQNLKNIRVPTFIVHGEQDLIISSGCSSALSQQIKGCESLILSGEGHALAEKLDANAAVMIRNFVKEVR